MAGDEHTLFVMAEDGTEIHSQYLGKLRECTYGENPLTRDLKWMDFQWDDDDLDKRVWGVAQWGDGVEALQLLQTYLDRKMADTNHREDIDSNDNLCECEIETVFSVIKTVKNYKAKFPNAVFELHH